MLTQLLLRESPGEKGNSNRSHSRDVPLSPFTPTTPRVVNLQYTRSIGVTAEGGDVDGGDSDGTSLSRVKDEKSGPFDVEGDYA
jgi:hypothetical protein